MERYLMHDSYLNKELQQNNTDRITDSERSENIKLSFNSQSLIRTKTSFGYVKAKKLLNSSRTKFMMNNHYELSDNNKKNSKADFNNIKTERSFTNNN